MFTMLKQLLVTKTTMIYMYFFCGNVNFKSSASFAIASGRQSAYNIKWQKKLTSIWDAIIIVLHTEQQTVASPNYRHSSITITTRLHTEFQLSIRTLQCRKHFNTYIHTYTHTITHTHTHTYIYIYIYICVCAYIQTFFNHKHYFINYFY